MIPSMIVFGLMFGRWWKTAIIAATVVWPLLLLSDGVPVGSPSEQAGQLIGGALLAAANAAVGVAAHQAIRLAVAVVSLVARTLRPHVGRRSAQP